MSIDARKRIIALVFITGAILGGFLGNYAAGFWLLLAAFAGLRLLGILPNKTTAEQTTEAPEPEVA